MLSVESAAATMPQLAIRCKSLTKRYPGGVLAVDGLDLEVWEGECFGLLGPNGAGKTTTIEVLEGLLKPTSGEVEVLGRSWDRRHLELRQEIGISLQETRLSERLSVRETLVLFRSFYANGLDPDVTIELVGLTEKARSWVGKLSGGQKQRLAVACALVGDPKLLFLDEPTTGLDPQSRRQLWEILKRLKAEGRTILITTHYMDEAERLCDRVAIIDRGKVIAADTPSALIAGLGGEHVIEFALANGALANGAPAQSSPELDAETLRGLASVREVRLNAREAMLAVSEPHVALPALLGMLQERGEELTRLTTRHASLDDVFVKLTGRHLSEDEARQGEP
jgi:ABC-2 type transport system ATP-binding protein